MNKTNKPQVVVIGLDGATFDLLRPMAQQGLLPNLERLMREGTAQVLRSTYPPLTAPAWTSFMTGVNPGKHGVFAFQRHLNARLEREWVNGRTIRSPRLWQIVGDHDLRVGVMNVPLTYPPSPVNGFLVTGMLTPSIDYDFAYPAELMDELRNMGYIVDLRIKLKEREVRTESQIRELVRDLRRVLLKREEAIYRLLESRPCHFFMVMFETPDRIQHFAWHYIEEILAGERRTEVHREIAACYQELDRVIGGLVAHVGTEATFFFLSDHGFCHLHTRVHLDQWLAEQGLLRYTRGKATVRKRLKHRMQTLKRFIPRRLLLRGRRAFAVLKIIDWEHTQVYSGRSFENALYVNLKGREPQGVVEPGEPYERLREQLRQALLALHDPSTGQQVVKAAYLREEVYDGPYLERAPDLLFELVDGYETTSEVSPQGIFTPGRDEGAGFHNMDGIFIAWGRLVQQGADLGQIAIPDLAPTILYAMGLPVPRYMDGTVMEKLFDPAYVAAHPVVYEEGPQPEFEDAPASSYSDEGAELIRRRLAGLGYL